MRPNSRKEPSQRVRAAKACQRCNHKRVKCDAVAVGQPCSRCLRNRISDCVLVESRRGRYSRDALISRGANTHRAASGKNGTASPPELVDEDAVDETSQEDQSTPKASNENADDSPERGAPVEVAGHVVSPLSSAAASASSYRDISWSAMFDHFLDSRQRHSRDVVDKCSITYLGEPFPLALVLEDLQDGGRTRLHHAGPPLEQAEATSESSEGVHPPHLLPEDMNCLNSKKAFEYPDHDTYNALMTTFLDVFFPLYPIVNRQEFLDQYKNDKFPWILLQSCCFVAATFCPESVLLRAGFAGRRQARFSFYRKAKALFDTGYESNKIVILQSMIMLTFWGGGPNHY